MKKTLSLLLLLVCLVAVNVHATNVTIGTSGRVTIELLGASAAFRNTMSVVSPAVGIGISGCQLESAGGLPGVPVVSEKLSQHGCRVDLDSDLTTPGTQGFAAGTTFVLNMCAKLSAGAACSYVWSSDPTLNSDGFDHVRVTTIVPGQVFRLNWEDYPGGGDQDFNDLIAVLRVNQDSDGDGLWDDWETQGIDTNGDGIIDLDLPALGANPNHKDIFVLVDYMDCTVSGGDCASGDTHSHRPKAAAINNLVAAFAAAPVSNPDGTNGVTLHVEVGNALKHQNFMHIPGACFSSSPGASFDDAKLASFGADNPKRFAYHYAIFGHQQASTTTSSGCGELPGNDFLVTLGQWNHICSAGPNLGNFCGSNGDCGTGGVCTPAGDIDGDGTPDGDVGTLMQQAGTLMHELGHNLNLHHGGSDDQNNKPNYLSEMNYFFQMSGIPPTGRLDYSESTLATLDENHLNEPAGIGDGTDNTAYFCPDHTVHGAAGNAAIDWNCDGDAVDTNIIADINNAGGSTILPGFDDWGNILYAFQSTADYDDGTHTQYSDTQEMTLTDYVTTVVPDIALTMAPSAATIVTGTNVTYTISVTNNHTAEARNVTVTDGLPAATTFVSCSSTGGGVCGGSGNNVTVTFASVPGGTTATVTVVATVSCSLASGVTITNSAVASTAPDSDPSNNSASATITASDPPPVISNVSTTSTQLWPPNHKMVDVTVSYTVTDNCPLSQIARTLTVSSNEPINGTGDGDTAPDWQVIDANHIRLRAERAATGTGRVYTITITAADAGGSSSTATALVTVPISQF